MTPADDNKLCSWCKSIDPCGPEQKRFPQNRTDTCPEFPNLLQSSRDGCQFCGLLRIALREKYSEEEISKAENDWDDSVKATWPATTDEWDHQVTIRSPGPRHKENWKDGDRSHVSLDLLSLTFWPYPPRTKTSERSLFFTIHADANSTAATKGPVLRRLLCTESLSQSNVASIQEWLETCSQDHSKCKPSLSHHCPTRLVDVGPPDGSKDPCLVITDKTHAAFMRYAALSHCWGPLQSLQPQRYPHTTRNNMDCFLNGMGMTRLPKTFQDAIGVVRKLGIRYLWIDALCIIQDDKEDWAKEAVQMNDVYGYAFLTIVATSSKSDADGFLHRSPLPPVVRMPYRTHAAPEISDGHYYLSYRRSGGDEGSWSRVFNESLWSTRGWTFQEYLLSKRVLHFTSTKIFWECRVKEGSEENEPPRTIQNETSWMKQYHMSGIQNIFQIERGSPDGKFDPSFDQWYQVLSRYSARQLTYHRDILPALSGIAAAFQDSHLNTGASKEYSAGLWLQDIFHGLLWMTHDSSKARRATEYLAPTWSWAAVIGHVQWPSRTIERHWQDSTAARFVDLVSEQEAGAYMLSGRLRIRARLHGPVSVIAPPETGILLQFPLDVVHDMRVIGNCIFDVDGPDEHVETGLYVVQIRKQNPWDSNFPYHPTALLLRQCEGAEAEYERVGCASLDEDHLDFFDRCTPTELTLV